MGFWRRMAENPEEISQMEWLEQMACDSEEYEVFAEKARNWMKKLSDTLTFD